MGVFCGVCTVVYLYEGVSVGRVFVRVFVSVFVGVFVLVGFCITWFKLANDVYSFGCICQT